MQTQGGVPWTIHILFALDKHVTLSFNPLTSGSVHAKDLLCTISYLLYAVSVKKYTSLRFSEIFSRWLRIFNPYFTCLLCSYMC